MNKKGYERRLNTNLYVKQMFINPRESTVCNSAKATQLQSFLWKGFQQLSCCWSFRAGRRAPSCGEAVSTELRKHVWQVLPKQWPVHAAGGHQRTPLQVRSCVCVCVSLQLLIITRDDVWLISLCCRCERGFYGPRCSNLELVYQPMGEEQIIATIFCVSLLIVGLAGALYFCCKW